MVTESDGYVIRFLFEIATVAEDITVTVRVDNERGNSGGGENLAH